LAILVNVGDRKSTLNTIQHAIPGAVFNPSTSNSSLGQVEIGGIIVVAKPINRQGGQSAGLQNETELIRHINATIATTPITVSFHSNKKTISFPNITRAISCGSFSTGRRKSDIQLVDTEERYYGISLKQDDASVWESADSYWGSNARTILDNLVQNGTIHMTFEGDHYKIEPNVAIKASEEEIVNCVFGSDILASSGAVIQRTFQEDDFCTINGNELPINVSSIIQNVQDIETEHTPWFLLRNDKTRRAKGLYPGIRVVAVYESRVYAHIPRISR
jgi:hypothetical protein